MNLSVLPLLLMMKAMMELRCRGSESVDVEVSSFETFDNLPGNRFRQRDRVCVCVYKNVPYSSLNKSKSLKIV